MSKLSIRFRLIALFIGLTVGPLLLVGLWAGLQNYQALRGMIETTQQLESRLVAAKTEEYLNGLIERFQLVCAAQNLLETGDRQRFVILNDMVAHEKSLKEFVLFSVDGSRLVHLTSGQAENLIDLDAGWTTAEFLNELSAKNLIYTQISYDDLQGDPYLLVAAAVLDPHSREIAGVGLARFSLNNLGKFLAGLDLRVQEEIMILGPNRRLLAWSHHCAYDPPLKDLSYQPEVVSGLTKDLEGRPVMMGLSGFNLGEQRLTVLTKADYWRAMRQYVVLVVALFAVLAFCLALAVFLGVLTVNKIVRPIEGLAKASLALKAGDYSHRIKVTTKDELGQLAEAFNTMAADLEHTIKRLKGEIASKTKAEAALRKSEAHFRDLVQNSPLGILVLNRRGQIIDINPQGLAILELGGLQEAGRLFFNNNVGFFQSDTAGLPFDFGPDYILKTVTRTMEVVYNPPSGPPKNLRCHLSLEPSPDAPEADGGNIGAYQLIIEDISEAKRLENHFRQSQKLEALGMLTGGIVHDFNNILSAVIGYTELALTGQNNPATLNHYLRQIMRASQRARELVRQILSFSRRTAQEKKPVHLAALVRETLKMIRATMPSTIWIASNIDNDLPAVMADSTQIHQMLMNLCTNAAHAMKDKGGVLTVSLAACEADEDLAAGIPDLRAGQLYQVLEVTDTGRGIPQEDLGRIFEPFFTTKAAGEGTGMGLSVAQGVVKSHSGAITVNSQVGQGAAFKVYLPQTAADTGQNQARPERSFKLRGHETILFVDDEPALVDIGRRSLERLGYQVVGKTDSQEALAVFAQDVNFFKMVITDQTMPNLTGMDLAEELLKLNPNLPIILCTGFTQETALNRAKDIGIRQVMLKPVIIKELAATMRSVFDGLPLPGHQAFHPDL